MAESVSHLGTESIEGQLYSMVNIGNLNSEFGHVSVISEGQAMRNSKAIANLGLLLNEVKLRLRFEEFDLFLCKWFFFVLRG